MECQGLVCGGVVLEQVISDMIDSCTVPTAKGWLSCDTFFALTCSCTLPLFLLARQCRYAGMEDVLCISAGTCCPAECVDVVKPGHCRCGWDVLFGCRFSWRCQMGPAGCRCACAVLDCNHSWFRLLPGSNARNL